MRKKIHSGRLFRRGTLALSLGGLLLATGLLGCGRDGASSSTGKTAETEGYAGSGADGAETTGEARSRDAKNRSATSVPDYVFTYADNQTGDYPTVQAARRFASMVNEATDGRIEIRVYANAELGDEISAVQQLSFGGIDFCRASLSTLTNYSGETLALQMPYLYKNSEHMWRVLDGDIGDEVKQSFQGSGLVALSWFDAGVRNFYTVDRPITCLEDMQDRKIRVQQADFMEDMVQELGALPVPIVYEAVKDAMQTGEIDGAENNWASYEAMGHDEIAPYYTVDEHMRVPELLLASSVTWEQLSAEDQTTIQRCADEAGQYERSLWKARETSAREKCLRNGVTEIVLSEDEQERFREAASPLYKKYCGDYAELIEKINEIRDR